jgi:hypothetical protein
MAKEQKRGNRETRKPKAAKAPATPQAAPSLKGATSPINPPKKKG